MKRKQSSYKHCEGKRLDLACGYCHGPAYPKMPASVAKSRRAGLHPHEIGEAVLAAIRDLQIKELHGSTARHHPCPCASRTWLSDGKAILQAVAQQNRRI